MLLFLNFVKRKQCVNKALECAKHSVYGVYCRKILHETVYPKFCEGIDALSCTETVLLHFSKGIRSMIDLAREDEECVDFCRRNERDKIALFDIIPTTFPQGSIKFIPVKVSGVIPLATLLRAADKLQSITYDIACSTTTLPPEIDCLLSVQSPLVSICHSAQQHGIRVLLDAEPSHVQTLIEFLGHRLCSQFNTTSPVVYSTYQCYLSRTPQHLRRDFLLAKKGGYCFAVKLVRGAYLRSETERADKLGIQNPILCSKAEVDNIYNYMMHSLLLDIAEDKRVALMIATHNRESVEHAVWLMSSLQLPPHHANVDFALIKGINAHIVHILARRRYNINVLLMCGEFDVLFPWLRRRIDENQVFYIILCIS